MSGFWVHKLYRAAQKSRTFGIALQLQFILQYCVDFLWLATDFAKITSSNSTNAFGPDLGSSPTLPVFLNLLVYQMCDVVLGMIVHQNACD